MKGSYLGEFEELVLLIVGALEESAYSMAIREELKKTANRNPSIGALHSALNRLEKKGFVDSKMADATSERGGRRKRIFFVTAAGKEALQTSRELRNQLWDQIPEMSWHGLKLTLLWT